MSRESIGFIYNIVRHPLNVHRKGEGRVVIFWWDGMEAGRGINGCLLLDNQGIILWPVIIVCDL